MEVLRPSYYELPKYSVNDVAEAWGLCYHLFNIFKYTIRAYKKNGLQDIEKAIVYLDRLESLKTIPRATSIGNINFQDIEEAWSQVITPTQMNIVRILSELQFEKKPTQLQLLTTLRAEIDKLQKEVDSK